MINAIFKLKFITVRTAEEHILEQTLHAYFKKKALTSDISLLDTPEQTGVRKTELALVLRLVARHNALTFKAFPLTFWAEAVCNRMHTQKPDQSSYHSWKERRITSII
ncbi:hypothetical protein Tco_0457838 [Tanacetum coccineum]